MTIKEVNEMRRNGLEKYETKELLDAYTIVNATKNTFATLEKDIKDTMETKMEVGEQLTLDFGNDSFTSKLVQVDEVSFDCSDDDLYVECSKVASAYCKSSVDKTAIKKDYIKGVLHPDIIKHIVIHQQETLKISKKAKKGEE